MKLGIDTGGTFTDFILHTDKEVFTLKIPSTPDDPSRAILAGLVHFFTDPHNSDLFQLPDNLEIVHGTTVGTNAFLQRKGARTLLVTTKGFEDVLYIGRQNRSALYDFNIERACEIIKPDCSIGINERVLCNGEIQTSLGSSVGKRLRRVCRQMSIESVAICLLHSYSNSTHEETLAKEIAVQEIPVSLSSDVLPEFREYERLCTTLINAYLAPVVSSYIDKLTANIGSHSLYIQQSNGGILPAESIGRRAVHTVLSGPAGGVHGAFQLAQEMGRRKIITFDMGGTSTDVSLCDGKPTLTRDYHIDSFPLRIQVMDIHTVGAGGGSLASVDQGGLLHVGPESAGADPGPVCYGKGENLTVTDANLFLGRLPADRFLGGAMSLHPARVAEKMVLLADELSMRPHEAALGIIRLVNIGMAKAIRAVSLERGYDPKEFSLFSFGGASGLHCCELAEELGVAEIVVPARAGILSAQGMVMAQPSLDSSKALFLTGKQIKKASIEKAFTPLVNKKTKEMERICQPGNFLVEKFVDLRYQGQSFELTVPFEGNFKDKFHQMHKHHFGYSLPNSPLELVSIRCAVTKTIKKQSFIREKAALKDSPVPDGTTSVTFDSGPVIVNMYRRDRLHYGHFVKGPALVSDNYTTILIPSHFNLFVDSLLNLIIKPN